MLLKCICNMQPTNTMHIILYKNVWKLFDALNISAKITLVSIVILDVFFRVVGSFNKDQIIVWGYTVWVICVTLCLPLNPRKVHRARMILIFRNTVLTRKLLNCSYIWHFHVWIRCILRNHNHKCQTKGNCSMFMATTKSYPNLHILRKQPDNWANMLVKHDESGFSFWQIWSKYHYNKQQPQIWKHSSILQY